MRTVLLAAACCLPLLAQDKKPDPKKADVKKLPRIAINDPAKLKDIKEYEIPGEYEGTFKNSDGEIKFGAQIVAMGDSKFDGVVYKKGLPGDGGDPQTRD